MDQKVKEKIKELARKDKVRFMNVIGYIILKEIIEKDPESQKLLAFINNITDLSVDELFDLAINKAMNEKPNLINTILGGIGITLYLYFDKKYKKS